MSANTQDAAKAGDPNYVIDPNAKVEEVEDDKPDPAALQAQLDDLTRKLEHEASLRTEAEKQAGFWYEKSIGKVEAAELKVEPPAFDISDDEWGEVLSDKKKFLGLIDKVATQRAEAIATTVTNEKAAEITGEQRRLQTAWAGEQKRLRDAGMPGLGDIGNPLTDLFAEKVRAMQQSGDYENVDPILAMKLAISEAEADYLRRGGTTGEQTEETIPRALNGGRSAAIAAQAGSKGRKAAPPDKTSNIPAEELELLSKHARMFFPNLPPDQALAKVIAQRPNVVKFRS